MAEYYMILTTAGQAAYSQAGAGVSPVQISAVAVGDGGGVAVQPAESWTALMNEVWRGAPTLVEVDADNPRLVLVEAHIPYSVGGWYIREVGLISPEGVLLAVGNSPESYKPALESGAGKELLIRAYIEHTNAGQTTLKINPDVVMASRTYVTSAVAAHDASPTAHSALLGDLSGHAGRTDNPHGVTAGQAGAEPAGSVVLHNAAADAHADIRGALGGLVPASRRIITTGAMQGGGDLTDDLTLTVRIASTTQNGVMEMATIEEDVAGTSIYRASTPAGGAARWAAKLASANLWTAVQRYSPASLTPASGVLTWDVQAHPAAVVWLTGGITSLVVVNPAPGATYELSLIQDATGGRSVAWPAAWLWPGGVVPDLPDAPGAESVVQITTRPGGTSPYMRAVMLADVRVAS